VIASGLDLPGAKSTKLTGTFIHLFSPRLAVSTETTLSPGERLLLLDPTFFSAKEPRVIAASAKITETRVSERKITFSVSSIKGRDANDLTVVWLLLPRTPVKIVVGGKTFGAHYSQGMLLLEFPATASPQGVEVSF
jgi:hypothetical protein